MTAESEIYIGSGGLRASKMIPLIGCGSRRAIPTAVKPVVERKHQERA